MTRNGLIFLPHSQICLISYPYGTLFDISFFRFYTRLHWKTKLRFRESITKRQETLKINKNFLGFAFIKRYEKPLIYLMFSDGTGSPLTLLMSSNHKHPRNRIPFSVLVINRTKPQSSIFPKDPIVFIGLQILDWCWTWKNTKRFVQS
jgi:hypothetical protein